MCSRGHRIGHWVGDVHIQVPRSFQQTRWFLNYLLADTLPQEALRKRIQDIGVQVANIVGEMGLIRINRNPEACVISAGESSGLKLLGCRRLCNAPALGSRNVQLDAIGLSPCLRSCFRSLAIPTWPLSRPNNISVVLNHLLDRPLTRLSCPIRSTTYRVNGAEACLSTNNTTGLSTLPHRVLKPHHLFPLPLGSHTGDQKIPIARHWII